MSSYRASAVLALALMYPAPAPAVTYQALAGWPALQAADALPPVIRTQAGGVKGQDVMQDRAGPDGWVQAPIPRVDTPSGAAPGEDKPNKSAESGRGNVPDTGKRLTSGQDPGTPMATPNGGP